MPGITTFVGMRPSIDESSLWKLDPSNLTSNGSREAKIPPSVAILSQADNAELGDRDPFDVWRTLKHNQRECASQQLCFVGKDDLLRHEAYDEFIDLDAE